MGNHLAATVYLDDQYKVIRPTWWNKLRNTFYTDIHEAHSALNIYLLIYSKTKISNFMGITQLLPKEIAFSGFGLIICLWQRFERKETIKISVLYFSPRNSDHSRK